MARNIYNKSLVTNYKSIYTEEPSLEDVFIKSTSEVDEDARA